VAKAKKRDPITQNGKGEKEKKTWKKKGALQPPQTQTTGGKERRNQKKKGLRLREKRDEGEGACCPVGKLHFLKIS